MYVELKKRNGADWGDKLPRLKELKDELASPGHSLKDTKRRS